VTRFLAGESLYRLAQWLTEEGVLPASAADARDRGETFTAKWTGPNLRHLLKAPHLAGIRVHKGTQYPGAWEAIIPVETHHHVVAMLADPKRRTNGTGSNARVYLLAGLMVCDECGLPVRGAPATKRRIAPAYRCPTGRHVHRPVELVDNMVEEAMVERLSRYDANGLLVNDEATAELARLTEARARMEDEYRDLGDLFTSGELSARAYAMATTRLEDDMTACDAAIRLAAAEVDQSSRVLDGAMGEAARLAWYGDGTEANPGWSLARKRAIIADLAEVRLRGGRRGTHSYRPEDVVINFR